MLFRTRLDCGSSIIQLFAIEHTNRFIVSTRETDCFCDRLGSILQSRSVPGKPGMRIWAQHPHSKSHILCIKDGGVDIYCSSSWEIIQNVSIDENPTNAQLKRVFPSHDQRLLITEYSERDGPSGTRAVRIFGPDVLKIPQKQTQKTDSPDDRRSSSASTISWPDAIMAKHISHVIGTAVPNRLVFLDKESWVSSIEICTYTTPKTYLRHFYVPYDWFSGAKDIICALTSEKRSNTVDWVVLLVKNCELAVIRGGFQSADERTLTFHTDS